MAVKESVVAAWAFKIIMAAAGLAGWALVVIGAPTCSDMQTKAAHSADIGRIEAAVEASEVRNEKAHESILSEVRDGRKEMMTEIREQRNEIREMLRARR